MSQCPAPRPDGVLFGPTGARLRPVGKRGWDAMFRDPDVPLATKGVGAALMTWACGKGGCHAHPGNARLADECGTGEQTIRRHLRCLVEAGYLFQTFDAYVNGRKSVWADEYQLTVPIPGGRGPRSDLTTVEVEPRSDLTTVADADDAEPWSDLGGTSVNFERGPWSRMNTHPGDASPGEGEHPSDALRRRDARAPRADDDYDQDAAQPDADVVPHMSRQHFRAFDEVSQRVATARGVAVEELSMETLGELLDMVERDESPEAVFMRAMAVERMAVERAAVKEGTA